MMRALRLQPDDCVLEVGSGSLRDGTAQPHRARCMAWSGARAGDLRSRAAAELGYDNVHIHHGDGTMGWPRGPLTTPSWFRQRP